MKHSRNFFSRKFPYSEAGIKFRHREPAIHLQFLVASCLSLRCLADEKDRGLLRRLRRLSADSSRPKKLLLSDARRCHHDFKSPRH
ncbi:UNVERIFIED_CONTAM: hypothetical protein Sradi_4568300 [Sesamum radiatum]|uniref:Uncharacterized protein n=1 Tax=Sesamum radiatum TaxID=300843 RepID=A0AAW2N9S9_SESRA